MSDGEIGVLGASGQQGSAVVRALVRAGVPVRALARNPASVSALTQLPGVRAVRADIDHPESLVPAFERLTALFAMTVFAVHGPAGEVAQGRAIADAAAAAQVPRLVYSSVGGAERDSGVPHFESKWAIEQYLRATSVPTLVLRPVFFMDNFLQSMAPERVDGSLLLRAPFHPQVPLQMIATQDVGAVAASLLLQPHQGGAGAVEVAGDELTPEDIAERLGQRHGLTGRFESMPIDSIPDDDFRAMFGWLTRTPSYQGDLALTKQLHPGVLDFTAFLASA